ncbi:MAG: YchF family ATPase [Candidatus Aminicenantes bacterium]|nr:YchF family ATPase [Candidatus Aminicenantes bacterium]
MKIGLIGLPNTGKTTIFNALTRGYAEVTSYSGGLVEPHLAVVEVRDERVASLSSLYDPQKTVYTTVDIIDFAGLSENSARDGSYSADAWAQMRTTDAITLVLRNFSDETMPAPDPLQELKHLEEEMVLADLILAENRLERIEHQLKRSRGDNPLLREKSTFIILRDHLSDSRPLRELDLNPEEEKLVRGYSFLTKKSFLVVLNSDESLFGKNHKLLEDLETRYTAVEFAGKFEMELSRLDDKDAKLFMEDMGIFESARDRMIRLAYRTLGYISFFTVGKDEVRAWNILSGQTALEAAGTIHSDLARGFIRAERFSYEDLITTGSEKSVRENGRFSLEGKKYVVHDGDILSIRFNV